MKDFKLDQLPQKIKVYIVKTQEGNYIAELSEYEKVFTQADSLEQLDFNINDLIRAYFDIPQKYHNDIWYRPIEDLPSEADNIKIPAEFQILQSQRSVSQWR
jgi:predicted RNase H-like HicB family nuclease